MTSLEALKKLEAFTNWSSDEDIDKDLYNLWGNVACRTIKKDLEALEIMKNKCIDNSNLRLVKLCPTYKEYANLIILSLTKIIDGLILPELTEEEFELLKEVLKDE